MTIDRRAALSLALCAMCAACDAPEAVVRADPDQEVIRIWPGKPPDSWSSAKAVRETQASDGKITNVTIPTLTVFRPAPERSTGAAMIVLPGGGFNSLEWDREGLAVAHWLTQRGITAFLLKYRVKSLDLVQTVKMGALMLQRGPNMFRNLMTYVTAGRRMALEDALQAVRIVRSNAGRYGISPERIGMIGFSAGAITTVSVAIEADQASRPNFAATLYGSALDEKAPPADAPPLFIVHCKDDPIIPFRESVNISQAWRKVGVPAELHLYATGVHGFGMRPLPKTASVAWPQSFEAWLRQLGVIKDQPAAAKD